MTDWWGGARRVSQQLSLILLFCPPITPWYNPCNGRDKKSLSCPLQHRSNKHKSQKIHIQAVTKNLNLANLVKGTCDQSGSPIYLPFKSYGNRVYIRMVHGSCIQVWRVVENRDTRIVLFNDGRFVYFFANIP